MSGGAKRTEKKGGEGRFGSGRFWASLAWRLLILLLLAALGWGQYVLWFGDQGLVRLRRTQGERALVGREIQEAETRIDRLKEEIWLLQEEPLAVEEAARRELGLVYPDEVIFVFPKRGK